MENEGINYSDYLYYDESSPTCLRWKVDRNQAVEINSKAGGFERDKEGNIVRADVQIGGRRHSINRVVWSLFHGTISRSIFVIYIDGDKSNNSIHNLRLKVKEDYPSRPRPSYLDKRILGMHCGIKERCGKKGRVQPACYAGADMHPEWVTDSLAFQAFIKTVPNWDSKDQNGRWFNVEKDLFCFNSDKFGYYPDTVCFLPRDINQALQLDHTGQRSKNRGLPVGVTCERGVYKAQISVNGKPKYLGSGTIEECKGFYLRAKVSRLEELIEIWKTVLPINVVNQLHLFVEHLKAL